MASSSRFFSTKQLIINAVGTDRCGIVSDLTKYVTDVGGNVGESQASKLGANFSLLMVVHVPENQVVSLVDHLEEIEDVTASVHMVKDDVKDDPTVPTPIGCKNNYLTTVPTDAKVSSRSHDMACFSLICFYRHWSIFVRRS